MLHDPARHEALLPIAWDEPRVRATIARIVDATVLRDCLRERAEFPTLDVFFGARGSR